MFISCRGLKVLVEMIDENYEEQKDLIWMAVDGICRVFEMQASIASLVRQVVVIANRVVHQGPTPRNDFCRMLAHEGLLLPVSRALISSAEDKDELAESATSKIVTILILFSQSDFKVKEAMATRPVALST
jgi:hypothetical protein